MPAPFAINPALMAIVIAFRNKEMIADEVLPRVPVGKQEFKWMEQTMAEGFTVPDTKVGRKSQPNQVSFSAVEKTGSTEDFGLDDAIPQSDIDNAPENYDPLGRASEGIMNIVELDREVRVASTVFNAATYGANNKVALVGGDQFSAYDTSDPISVINGALDSMVLRGNIMTIGRAVFSKLATHPQIVKAVHGNSGDAGVATRRQIAELFELEDILVGSAWVNTAKKGQAMSLARTWGKHLALLYRDKTADTRSGVTFGVTAQFGTRIAGQWEDKNIGLRGGTMVRAGESVKEVICAPDLGYFVENAIAD
jgi:hypothetical protein